MRRKGRNALHKETHDTKSLHHAKQNRRKDQSLKRACAVIPVAQASFAGGIVSLVAVVTVLTGLRIRVVGVSSHVEFESDEVRMSFGTPS